MFKQKPKYAKPDVQSLWIGAQIVFTASNVSFGDTGIVSSEDFVDDGFIDF